MDEQIASMTIEQAETLQLHSAQIHTMQVLWSRLPIEQQGDRTEAARALRAARAETAAIRWLAATERLWVLEHA